MIRKVFQHLASFAGGTPDNQTIMVPGECFFTEVLSLPPGIANREIPQFAAVSLESLSPFPVEQVVHGFLHLPGSDRILLYAAWKERIRTVCSEEKMAGATHVLPSFVASIAWKAAHPTVHFLLQGKSLSLVLVQPDSSIPRLIHTVPVNESEAPAEGTKDDASPENTSSEGQEVAPEDASQPSSEAIFRARSRLLEHPVCQDSSIVVDSGFHACEFPRELPDGSLRFSLRHNPGSEADRRQPDHHVLFSPGSDLPWNADLRDASLTAQRRAGWRKGQLIWRATAAAIVVGLALLASDIARVCAKTIAHVRENRVQSQAQEVRDIENRDTLTKKIVQACSQHYRPFAMLEAVSQYRPRSIHFLSVESKGENQLTLTAQARSMREINAWADTLRVSGFCDDVQPSQTSTSREKVEFTLDVRFHEGALEPLIPAMEAGTPKPAASQASAEEPSSALNLLPSVLAAEPLPMAAAPMAPLPLAGFSEKAIPLQPASLLQPGVSPFALNAFSPEDEEGSAEDEEEDMDDEEDTEEEQDPS